jgi:hypothetical protein
MAFTEIELVRSITGVSEDSYSDEEVQTFISLAQKEITAKIQQKVIREPVVYLDGTRENDLAEDTTFYFANWKGNYLGDLDYDGNIDVSDIIVYQVDNDDMETILTPTSISNDNMSFTLSSIPGSNVDLFVTYCYSPFNMIEPDYFLSQATAYLAASYLDLTDGSDDSIRFGNVSISGSGSSGMKGNKFYQKYLELMNQLIENSTGGAIWGQSFVQI